MTTDLYLTPTRRAVLAAVEVGEVYRRMDVDGKLIDFWRLGPGRSQRVTARCVEMERAGWIETCEADDDASYTNRPWRLTDVGRAALNIARLPYPERKGVAR